MSIVTSGGLRISGIWTKAGCASCVSVKGKNKGEDILFDLGVGAETSIPLGSAKFVFISHSHVDHIGGIISHARFTGLSQRKCTYYVPQDCIQNLEDARLAMSRLDGADIPMVLVPISPGITIPINETLFVRVFPTVHRVPSVGFAVYRKEKVLRSEFSNYSKTDLGELKRRRVNVYDEPVENLEMVYTGDTTFEGIHPTRTLGINVFMAEILIMELTYLDGDRSKAIERYHVHIQDIIENAHVFLNKQIVFCHLSSKYGPASKCISMLRNALPAALADRVAVSLRAFGAEEDLTKVVYSRQEATQFRILCQECRQVAITRRGSWRESAGGGRGVGSFSSKPA